MQVFLRMYNVMTNREITLRTHRTRNWGQIVVVADDLQRMEI